MAGLLLIAAGGALAGWAALAATSGQRPLDLVAGVLAPVGVGMALLGALALALPGFLF